MTRLPAWILSALVLALVVGACTPGREGQESVEAALEEGGSVTFGVLGEPLTLAPYSKGASELTWALARPVYPSLFRFAPDGTARPYLAASAEERGQVVVVELADMRWSDGREISARDVVESARRARDPSGFLRFERISAQGASRLEFEGVPEQWKEALATVAFVLPGGRASVDPSIAGGPFQVTSYVPGLEIVYERNPEWSGDPPVLDEITVQFIENLDIMLGLLREGDLDAASPPSTINLAQRLNEMGIEHASRLGWETVFAEFNPTTTTSSERVAVANALDRADLVGNLMGGEGRLSYTLTPSPGPAGADGPFERLPSGGVPPIEPVGVAAAVGDEVMALLERAIFKRFESEGIETEFLNVAPRTFYGSWRHESPADLLLRRTLGAPHLARRSPPADLTALPLAHVRTYVAWRGDATGFAPNPTFEGPLWNAHQWGFVAD